MKTTFLLLVSLTTVVLAAPRRPVNTYDQRQDGNLNVHAKLDNFLFVFAPSSGANLDVAELVDNPLVAAALDLKKVDSRGAVHPEESQISGSHDQPQGTYISPVEAALMRITGQGLAKKKTEDDESGMKIVAIIQEDHPIEAVSSQSSYSNLQEDKKEDVKENLAKSEDHSKRARSLKNRSPEILSVSKLPPRESGLEPLENKVTGMAGKDRGNDVGSGERELQLLGGGIENCGPDRFRNRLGVCQFRVDA